MALASKVDELVFVELNLLVNVAIIAKADGLEIRPGCNAIIVCNRR